MAANYRLFRILSVKRSTNHWREFRCNANAGNAGYRPGWCVKCLILSLGAREGGGGAESREKGWPLFTHPHTHQDGQNKRKHIGLSAVHATHG